MPATHGGVMCLWDDDESTKVIKKSKVPSIFIYASPIFIRMHQRGGTPGLADRWAGQQKRIRPTVLKSYLSSASSCLLKNKRCLDFLQLLKVPVHDDAQEDRRRRHRARLPSPFFSNLETSESVDPSGKWIQALSSSSSNPLEKDI